MVHANTHNTKPHNAQHPQHQTPTPDTPPILLSGINNEYDYHLFHFVCACHRVRRWEGWVNVALAVLLCIKERTSTVSVPLDVPLLKNRNPGSTFDLLSFLFSRGSLMRAAYTLTGTPCIVVVLGGKSAKTCMLPTSFLSTKRIGEAWENPKPKVPKFSRELPRSKATVDMLDDATRWKKES